MPAETHRFRIGSVDCLAVADGLFNYPLQSFFANVPEDELEPVLRGRDLPTDQIATPYTCLFFDTGEHRVMIDTGAGTLGAHAAAFFPTVDHATTVTGRLVDNLRAAGIEPSAIDTVIITHAHPDHIGGTLDAHGDLVFGNAQYYVPEAEWNFWFSNTASEKAPAPFVQIARENLTAIRERLHLFGEGSVILPGVEAVDARGHTPGQIALAVSSDGERLMHMSDVVLHPLHLEYPAWRAAFDMDPGEAARSRDRVFDRAAEEAALVFAHHFPPYPSLGYVTKQKTGWRWEPAFQLSV